MVRNKTVRINDLLLFGVAVPLGANGQHKPPQVWAIKKDLRMPSHQSITNPRLYSQRHG